MVLLAEGIDRFQMAQKIFQGNSFGFTGKDAAAVAPFEADRQSNVSTFAEAVRFWNDPAASVEPPKILEEDGHAHFHSTGVGPIQKSGETSLQCRQRWRGSNSSIWSGQPQGLVSDNELLQSMGRKFGPLAIKFEPEVAFDRDAVRWIGQDSPGSVGGKFTLDDEFGQKVVGLEIGQVWELGNNEVIGVPQVFHGTH